MLHHKSSPSPHSESKLQLDNGTTRLSQTFQNNSSLDDQRNTPNQSQALNCNEENKLQSMWHHSDGLDEHTNKILEIKFNLMNNETAASKFESYNTKNKKSKKINEENFNPQVLKLNEYKFAEHKQFDTCTNVNQRTTYDTNNYGSNNHGCNNHGCCGSRSGPNQYELSNNINGPGPIHDTEYSCIRSRRFMSEDSCARSEKSSVRYYNASEKESPFFQYPVHQSGKGQDLHHGPRLTLDQTFLKHCNGPSSHQHYQQNTANKQLPSSHQLLKVTQSPEQFLKGTSECFEPAINPIQGNPSHRRMSVQYSPEICNMPSNQYGFSQMTNQHDMFQMRMHQHNLALMSTNNQESSRVHHTEQQLTPLSGLPAFPFCNTMGNTSSLPLEQTHKLKKLHQHQQHLLQKMSANGNKFAINNDLDRISAISNNPFFGFVNPPVFGFNGLPLGLRNFSQRSMNIPEYSHQAGKDQRPISPRNALVS